MTIIDKSNLQQKVMWWEVQDGWDWSMSDVDISKVNGQSADNVRARRRKLGIPGGKVKLDKRRWWRIPGNWDWSMSNSEIARVLEIDVSGVAKRRKLLGLCKKPKVVKWWENTEGWDWSMSNMQIARATGATYYSVYKRRHTMGMVKVDPTASFHKDMEALLKGFLSRGGDVALFKSLMQQTLDKITKCQKKSKSSI